MSNLQPSAIMDEIAKSKFDEHARFMVRLNDSEKDECLVEARLILRFIAAGFPMPKLTKNLVRIINKLPSLRRNGFEGVPSPEMYSQEYCYDHSFRKQQHRDIFLSNILQYLNINPLSAPCFTCWIMANVLEAADVT